VDDENWHHYVMTAPVSGTLADVKVFMDGVEQTGQQELNGDDANIFDTGNTYDLRIGARPFDGPVPTLGQLDEIAVFSSELTSAEVVAIYNSGAGLDLTEDAGDYESSANLELYYKLEEGTGTTAVDSSGNSRNGAITGGTWVAGF
jgi:hypothetical protein